MHLSNPGLAALSRVTDVVVIIVIIIIESCHPAVLLS